MCSCYCRYLTKCVGVSASGVQFSALANQRQGHIRRLDTVTPSFRLSSEPPSSLGVGKEKKIKNLFPTGTRSTVPWPGVITEPVKSLELGLGMWLLKLLRE